MSDAIQWDQWPGLLSDFRQADAAFDWGQFRADLVVEADWHRAQYEGWHDREVDTFEARVTRRLLRKPRPRFSATDAMSSMPIWGFLPPGYDWPLHYEASIESDGAVCRVTRSWLAFDPAAPARRGAWFQERTVHVLLGDATDSAIIAERYVTITQDCARLAEDFRAANPDEWEASVQALLEWAASIDAARDEAPAQRAFVQALREGTQS